MSTVGGKVVIAMLVVSFANIAFSNHQERILPNANVLGNYLQNFVSGNLQDSQLAQLQQQFFTQVYPNISPEFLLNLLSWYGNVTGQANVTPNDNDGSGKNRERRNVNQQLLRPSLKPAITTLPFDDVNLADFPWLTDNLSEAANTAAELISNEKASDAPLPKILPANFTNADINFLTAPQLLNLFGR